MRRRALLDVSPDVGPEGVYDLGDLVPLLLLVKRGQKGHRLLRLFAARRQAVRDWG